MSLACLLALAPSIRWISAGPDRTPAHTGEPSQGELSRRP